jgi:hypothetical protein
MTRWLEGIVFWIMAVVAIVYVGVRFALWLAWLVTRWIFDPAGIQE